ncbi:MAG: oxidoreductase domain protein [Clostridia bacterium]|nr:oxidoreductase domain protein [Clostridia bacterium]
MKKIRIGLIGCGGRQGAHLNSFRQMDNVEVVAVADPVEERRLAAARQTGAKRIYKDHTDLYNHESSETLDVVYIAIEPTAHTDTETRAIEMGIPFLVEKPMTLDLNQAEKIAAMVAEKKLLTAVGFQDRYLDLMEMVKEEIPKHKSGLVYGAWIGGIPGVWWWQKKSTCGGQLLEQNIHLLDGLRWLYGEPLSVYATASTGIVRPGIDASAEYDTDDHSTCLIRFKNNITATLVSACYSKTVRPNCGFVITLDDMVLDYRLRNNLIISTANKTIDINRGNDQTLDLDRAFIHAIETNDGSGIRSPYADALKTLKLAFEANRSMETGEVIYFK